MDVVQVDFSEPYNIYTYRYFIHNWQVGFRHCKFNLFDSKVPNDYFLIILLGL